jgi:uncharacterized membrane protein YphA (DoxX/SURF4 family)
MPTPPDPSESSPRRRSWPRVPLVVGRVALGAIFLYAAYSKLYFDGAWHLRDYQFFFAMAIDSYKMLPLSVVKWMASILPWFELLLGGLLIAGVGLRWVGSITSALLLVFIGAMVRVSSRQQPADPRSRRHDWSLSGSKAPSLKSWPELLLHRQRWPLLPLFHNLHLAPEFGGAHYS